jgi:hypothetical protein
MNNYDSILKEFVWNKDNERPALLQPQTVGDNVYASNGHVAIKVPIGNLEGKHGTNDPYLPMLNPFQDNRGTYEKPKTYSVQDIKKLFAEIPMQNISVICQACNGSGWIDKDENTIPEGSTVISNDDEDETVQCTQCRGEGMVLLYEEEFDEEEHKIVIQGSKFNPNYIDKLLKVANVNDIETIEHLQGSEFGQHRFKIAEIEVIIMPMRMTEGDVPQKYHTLEEKKNESLQE